MEEEEGGLTGGLEPEEWEVDDDKDEKEEWIEGKKGGGEIRTLKTCSH